MQSQVTKATKGLEQRQDIQIGKFLLCRIGILCDLRLAVDNTKLVRWEQKIPQLVVDTECTS